MQKTARPDLYDDLMYEDLLPKIIPLLQSHFIVRPEDGKIVPRLRQVEYDLPWIFAKKCKLRQCSLWHQVAFKAFGIIPAFCFSCWKIVVRPKSILDLLALHDLQAELAETHGFNCKCGIEKRKYVDALYGGYFYENDLSTARQNYEIVREAVNKIDPTISVILKRGCTEFEITFGPSDQWKVSKDRERVENWIREYVEIPPEPPVQPSYVKTHIMKNWLEYAYTNGDMTVLALNHGQPMVTPVVTYHEKGE